MIRRPDKWTVAVAVLGVLILFVPIPVITQLVGLPLVVYACYRYWGRDDLGSASWGVRGFASTVAHDVVSGSGPDADSGRGADADRRSVGEQEPDPPDGPGRRNDAGDDGPVGDSEGASDATSR